jgi:hypothetical protein
MPEFYHAPALTDPQDGKPHIFVATPATSFYGNHVASVVRGLPFLMLGGMAVDYYLLTGCCHVDDARNICVGAFLKTNCEALIFIDADIGFPAEALYRLATHQGDVVAGVYPRRDAVRSWPFKFEPTAEMQEGEDGVVRSGILGLPTGFMKIHRRVLFAMSEIEPRRFDPFGTGEAETPIIFERDYDYRGGERLSGDYAFCAKARALGFELALDPHLPFTHAGEARFGGRLADEMMKQEKAA